MKKSFLLSFLLPFINCLPGNSSRLLGFEKAPGCNRTCTLQVIYQTKVVTFFSSWNFSEQIRIWFYVGILFNNILKVFFPIFFNPTGNQFDARSPHSVFRISAVWPHCDWADGLHVWMNMKASASGSDVTPEFQIHFPLTPTIYETSKCILCNLFLFWFVLELCGVIPDKTGPSILN